MCSVTNKVPTAFTSATEFVQALEPLFAAHPGELVMAVKRDDDNGFRGGPDSCEPFSPRGVVVNSSYELGVIDPAKTVMCADGVIVFPTGRSALVHCQGLNTLNQDGFLLGVTDLLLLSQKLSMVFQNSEIGFVPALEILIGDQAVVSGLAQVGSEREAAAIARAARVLGRQLSRSALLQALEEKKIAQTANALILAVFGPRPMVIDRHAIQQGLEEMKDLGVNPDNAVLRCVEILLGGLKRNLTP